MKEDYISVDTGDGKKYNDNRILAFKAMRGGNLNAQCF
jgi:hypothetical protein